MISKGFLYYKRFSSMTIVSGLFSGFILLPLLFLLIKSFHVDLHIIKEWLQSGLLWVYTYHTIGLMFSVALICVVLGCTTAWTVVYYQLPKKGWIEFLILLPFVMPPWIASWSWKELLDYGGVWHSGLKGLNGLGLDIDPNRWLIPLDNLTGASLIMGLSFYPYVYLLCRTAFLHQSVYLFESARLMNCSPWRFFYAISLPMARPALAAGVLIVMMEALNDFGTVRYFSVPVLALAVEDAWVYRASPGTAAAISVVILIIALFLLSLEHGTRNKEETFIQVSSERKRTGYRLTAGKSIVMLILLLLPSVLGFFIPFFYLFNAMVRRLLTPLDWSRLLDASWNSFLLAGVTAIISTLFATVLIWSSHYTDRVGTKKLNMSYFLSRTASLGYAVPGMILGSGVLIFASFLDEIKALLPFANAVHFIFVGSAILLVYAWMVRFLSLAIGNVDSGLSRIHPNLISAAHSLGLGRLAVLRRIYLPLLKQFMGTAVILIFIECVKELPIAFLIRPFNMELLSLYVWQYGSMEQLEEAAPGAMILIILSLVPLSLFWRRFSKQ